jgi:hypothetical protein
MGNGGPEQGHDAVTGVLVDGPLIAMHLLGQDRETPIHNGVDILRVKACGEGAEAGHVGEEHGDLLAFAFQGAAGGENLLGQIGGCVGARRRHGCLGGQGSGWRRAPRLTGPDQDFAGLIHRQPLAFDEFNRQVFQRRVVELELPLEGAVGHPTAALEHRHRVVQNLLKGHR